MYNRGIYILNVQIFFPSRNGISFRRNEFTFPLLIPRKQVPFKLITFACATSLGCWPYLGCFSSPVPFFFPFFLHISVGASRRKNFFVTCCFNELLSAHAFSWYKESPVRERQTHTKKEESFAFPLFPGKRCLSAAIYYLLFIFILFLRGFSPRFFLRNQTGQLSYSFRRNWKTCGERAKVGAVN